jgi:hypothetical protein
MSKVAALVGVVAIACGAPAWAADAPNPDPAAVQAQLLSMCEALKPRGGSCGARARERAADSTAMSSAAPGAAAGDAPGGAPVKPVDAWGNPLRISIDNGSLKLESPGADGELNSADDVVQRCPMN